MAGSNAGETSCRDQPPDPAFGETGRQGAADVEDTVALAEQVADVRR